MQQALTISPTFSETTALLFQKTPGPEDSAEARASVVVGNNSTSHTETERRNIVSGSGNKSTSTGVVTDAGPNNTLTSIFLKL